ncbi:sensor histidine kinase [Ramlibacter sp.]|uniref:sensor histidine kinase n=1 Tax=Ramlibacter sp. TaxID=1917967 RepID=UPI003D0D047A
MKRQPAPIGRLLILLVLVSILPAALLVGALLVSEYRRERLHLETSTTATARAMATAIDQRLAGLQGALNVLATSRLIAPDTLHAFQEQAREVQSMQGLAVIGLVDRELRPVMNTAQPVGSALRPPSSAAHLGDLFVSRRPVTTNLFRGSLTGMHTFAMAVPVVRAGEARYALVGGLAPESMREILLRQTLPQGWTAAVVDREGTVVARSADHAQFVGVPVRDALRGRLDAAPEGSMEGTSLSGVDVLTTFSTAPLSGWRVVVSMPLADLTRELRQALTLLTLGTLAVLAASIAFAVIQGRRLSASVQELKRQAVRLGAGQPVESIEASFLEAQELSTHVARASSELRQANAELTAREEELRMANDRLGGLVESAMDGIVSVDAQQNVVVFNRAAEQMFGKSRAEVVGQSLETLIPARLREGHRHHVDDFGASGATTRRMGALGIVHGLRADGSEFPLEASISQVRTSQGLLFTAVVRDVSEKMRAVEELRQLSARAAALREHDKKRIARELHDDIAQTLAALKLDIAWLIENGNFTDAARTKLRRMGHVLSEGIVGVRRIAADLRPVILDELGLPAALEHLADTFAERTGARCIVDMEPDLYVDSVHSTEVYRMVQEALSNAAKHAAATRVQIFVAARGRGLSVVIEDDGVGFDVDAPRRGTALGLRGLQERIQLLNGVGTLWSSPGKGTRVEAVFPAGASNPAVPDG